MADPRSRQIIIAGAGMAGLTTALAFAARGFSVQLFERAARLEEVGAGLQLSPNATRLLARLGVIESLLPAAVKPEAVVLRDARSLAEIARVPLGDAAEQRWKAPYLVVHRADLQSVLLARVEREPDIRLVTGATVRDVAVHRRGVTVAIDHGSKPIEATGLLLVGADGVWSSIRGLAGEAGRSRFSGQIAWRTTIRAEGPAGEAFLAAARPDVVTAFVHRGAHLIAYPVRGGAAVNLAAFAPGPSLSASWAQKADAAELASKLSDSPALTRLIAVAGPWTVWPLHTVDPARAWTAPGGLALVGDAAHALTPFAAQGAAMAIEDAVALASLVAGNPDDLPAALATFERRRRERLLKVARRGAFNRFVWHASGPVALGRNLFLKMRSPERLAADLDWLYGWDAEADTAVSHGN